MCRHIHQLQLHMSQKKGMRVQPGKGNVVVRFFLQQLALSFSSNQFFHWNIGYIGW